MPRWRLEYEAERSQVTVTVRPMTLQETALIIEYFRAATPEHLELLIATAAGIAMAASL